jgi:hypothetical protein
VPIEDFFHEVAFNEMNAGRGQFVPKEPWRRRFSRLLSPAARRAIAVLVTLAVVGAAGVFRQPLLSFLNSQSAHRPGAADTLTFVNHRSPPDLVAQRLAVACAREEDAAGCQDALKLLLKLTNAAAVAKALAIPEIKALRANDFFHRFAREVESQDDSRAAPAKIVPPPGALP